MKHILIIEDNQINLKLVRDLLNSSGYRVHEAGTGSQGITRARDIVPDLIIMDIQLPDMDGYEATARLKDDSITAAIPVIAITAFAMQGDREKILAAGFDYYMAKPIQYKKFLQLVATILKD